MAEPIDMSASEIRAAIAAGRLTATAATQAYIARIEQVNDALNAVILPLFDDALEQARAADETPLEARTGRLFGVPVTIKDNYKVRGTPTSCGLAHRSDTILDDEGSLITALRREGAIFLGKTNLPQLLVSHQCEHARYGAARNPWDLERTPGGSSGGEAAIIAARGSPLGLGSDMGGSVRVPAHCCGITALKPTGDRFPNDDTPATHFAGFWGFEGWRNQPGPMARTVDDLKLMMDALLCEPLEHGERSPPMPWSVGPIGEATGLRVGFYTDNNFFAASPALRRVVRETADQLAASGFDVRPFEPPDPARGIAIGLALLGADGGRWARDALAGERATPDIQNVLRVYGMPDPIRPAVAAFLRWTGQHHAARSIAGAGRLDGHGYWRACIARSGYRAEFVRAMREADVDVLLCPPYGLAAPLIDSNANGAGTLAASHAALFNIIGLPAGVVPVDRVRADEQSDRHPGRDRAELDAQRSESGSSGLPVAVQIVGRHWREDQVLAMMKHIEAERGSEPMLPPDEAHTPG